MIVAKEAAVLIILMVVVAASTLTNIGVREVVTGIVPVIGTIGRNNSTSTEKDILSKKTCTSTTVTPKHSIQQ